MNAGGPQPGMQPVVPIVQELFPAGSVRLLEGPFKTMQDVDHAYLLRLEPDRLLSLFRVEAGLAPKGPPYGGWEAPAKPGTVRSLAGHTLGHYLSAISLMYRMTGDYRLKDRASYLVQELKECQDKRGDGSLVAFPFARELEADIRAGKVETIEQYWAPLYTIHKELAGLRDAWLYCDDPAARDVLRRLADWCGSLVAGLPDEQRERFLNAEHGGMAEVLADVYAITRDPRYLDFARLYSHRVMLEPLAAGVDILTDTHANTQIPKFVGFQRIHELTGERQMGAAAECFWTTVVATHSWVNGGNSIHEHFPAPISMGAKITEDGGPETCNTYNMLKLTAALYRERPDSSQVDYYENALFNHILTSQAPLTGAGAFVYYTPFRPDYARSYGTDFNSFWCCTGTGMENHARYGEFIYSHDGKALSVNLFIASTLHWPGRGMELRQETRFPDEAGTTLVITQAPEASVPIRIRHPAWLAADALVIRLNGRKVASPSQPGGYAVLNRAWKSGDRIDVELPMGLRVVRQPNADGWVSLFYGPILLAGELGSEGLAPAHYIGCYTPARALRPLAQAPLVVAASDADILARVWPVPGLPATFRTAGLVKPGDVTLLPFYRVHFQRYAVYWQLTDIAGAEAQMRRMAEGERVERELDSRTVDRVRIGEQQPETDHQLHFENSQTGIGAQGRRWRDARAGGWFSYELSLPPTGQAAVRVLHWGRDDGREFDVLVDDKVIMPSSRAGGNDDYDDVEYPLDGSLTAGKERVTIMFRALPGKCVRAVYDLRIMRQGKG